MVLSQRFYVRVLKLLALTALLSPCFSAKAAEEDWLYFPMYARDTSHAVHLGVLQFRDDGLLESATRYPARPDPEKWSKAQIDLAWHVYSPRLIDCETGLHVETHDALLDQNSEVIAKKAIPHDRLVARIVGQLGSSRHTWPSRSEIFLACAGASSETLKTKRAERKAPPLISYQPLTETFAADSELLFDLTNLKYDFSVFYDEKGLEKAIEPAALFDTLRAQYVAWRRSFNPAYQLPISDNQPGKDFRQTEAQIMMEMVYDIRSLGSGVFEYRTEGQIGYYLDDSEWPERVKDHPRATRSLVNRIDCVSQLSVPQAYTWYDEGVELEQVPLSGSEVLKLVMPHYGGDDVAPDVWSVSALNSTVFYICAAVNDSIANQNARRKAIEMQDMPKVGPAVEAGDSPSNLPYGVTQAMLAEQKTAAEMLLTVRAARRRALGMQ